MARSPFDKTFPLPDPGQQHHRGVPPGSTLAPERVDLAGLRRANRKIHVDSGLRFPEDMLALVAETSSKEAARGDGSGTGPRIYLVVVGEPRDGPKTTPIRSIEAATHDLALANELAIARLREEWSRYHARLMAKRSKRQTDQEPRVEWTLDDALIRLKVCIPGEESLVRVWVEMQAIVSQQ